MGKVIVSVLVVLALLAYGACFLSWNLAPQEVTGFVLLGTRYSQSLPLGSLVFIGLVLGAVVMAIATWSAWASQKATADKHAATIRRAKAKLQDQLDEINDLRAEVERLEGQVASLQSGDGTWGQVTQADIAAGAAATTPTGADPSPDAAVETPEVDDPDVI